MATDVGTEIRLDRETITAVINHLYDSGRLGVIFCGDNGCRDLSADEALACLDDPDGFVARELGISKKVYLAWRNSDFHCKAKTRRGSRCKKASAEQIAHPDELKESFDASADVYNYCMNHLGYR